MYCKKYKHFILCFLKNTTHICLMYSPPVGEIMVYIFHFKKAICTNEFAFRKTSHHDA